MTSIRLLKDYITNKILLTHRHKESLNKSDLSVRKAILDSKLFNKDFYVKNNIDVAESGVDPLDHFINYGGIEGRSSSVNFNSYFYCLKNKIKDVEINPLFMYIQSKEYGESKNYYKYSNMEYDKYIGKFINTLDRIVNQKDSIYIAMMSMDWDAELQQRPHHLARELSELGVIVLYVELGNSVRPRKEANNIFIISEKIYKEIIKTSKNKGYFWCFSPTNYLKLSNLKDMNSLGVKIIYDYIDEIDEDISKDANIQKEIFDNLKVVDPVFLVASAKVLMDNLYKKVKGKKIILAQNAVNVKDFDINKQRTLPPDLKKIRKTNRSIVGFYGAIAPWLDYGLINKIVKHRTDIDFVFIGVDYNDSLKNLDKHSNLYFLGPKDYRQLSDYSHWFDCAIIPFKKGDIAKSTSPVKLFEYMAMGLPTVCTKDLNECKGYEYVYMSESDEEFSKNIDLAIKAKKSPKARAKLLQYAKQNTWEARVEHIYQRILELEGED